MSMVPLQLLYKEQVSLYMNYKLSNDNPNETAKIVETSNRAYQPKGIVHFHLSLASNCQGYEEAPF